jgi:hypothetical protein
MASGIDHQIMHLNASSVSFLHIYEDMYVNKVPCNEVSKKVLEDSNNGEKKVIKNVIPKYLPHNFTGIYPLIHLDNCMQV